jgi:hypothetical protein
MIWIDLSDLTFTRIFQTSSLGRVWEVQGAFRGFE